MLGFCLLMFLPVYIDKTLKSIICIIHEDHVLVIDIIMIIHPHWFFFSLLFLVSVLTNFFSLASCAGLNYSFLLSFRARIVCL